MLFKIRSCVTGLLLAVFLCLSAVHVFAAAKIVAQVGSVPITVFELSRELQKLIPLASGYHKGISKQKVDELSEVAMTKVIEQAYMVQYALTEELSVSSAEIDEVLLPVRERFPSESAFETALGEETKADFRASIYRLLLAKKAEDLAVEQNVKIIEADIKADYDANMSRYKRPRQFRASSILLSVDPAATPKEKSDKLEFAKKLVSQARSGEDFYDLAYYNSDDRTKYVGGDMGYFHEGQVLEEIQHAVEKMKVGEISDPVTTLRGYIIIKLVEDNPPVQLTFLETKDKLIAAEEQRQRERLRGEWLERLKETYKVERFAN